MNIYRNISDLPVLLRGVITIGSFDGVHKGHQKILERVTSLSKEIGGQSVVITFHPHPRKIIFPKDDSLQLLTTLDEKLELLKRFKIDIVLVVPFTVEFSQMIPAEYVESFLLKCFNPAYIVIGYDHRFGRNRGGDITLLKTYEESHHFKVIEIPKFEIEEISISSTKIRRALEQGNITEANQFLNHHYTIGGKVVHGDKLGTKLGYPTANLLINSKEKLIPREGVYAVIVNLHGEYFDGMLYIGKRPTITHTGLKSIEVHLFDFNQDIYDQYINIEIVQFLRDDIRFDDLDALKTQLSLDEKNARIYLEKHILAFENKALVTLAILNYNGIEYLESFLPMMMFSSQKYHVDILVIDNNSTDGSVEYIHEWHPEIKVIELSKNYGFSEGYNKGINDIESEYIVFMNSDVLVRENWLDPLIDIMESDKTIGACQPIVLSLEHKTEFEYAGAAGGFMDILGYPFCRGRIFDTVERNEGQYNSNCDIFWASGAALVTRTKLFNKMGRFDTDYFAHHEEIDYCWRIKRAGYSIQCIATSQIYHLGGGTLAYDNPQKTYLNFRNNLITILKNEPAGRLLWIFPLRLVLDAIAGVKFLFEGKANSLFALVRAHWHIFTNIFKIIKIREAVSKTIDKNRIGFFNDSGRFYGSVVWLYFIRGIKKFSELLIK